MSAQYVYNNRPYSIYIVGNRVYARRMPSRVMEGFLAKGYIVVLR